MMNFVVPAFDRFELLGVSTQRAWVASTDWSNDRSLARLGVHDRRVIGDLRDVPFGRVLGSIRGESIVIGEPSDRLRGMIVLLISSMGESRAAFISAQHCDWRSGGR